MDQLDRDTAALDAYDRRKSKPLFTHYPGNCLHCYCGTAPVNEIPHKTCCMCGTRCKVEGPAR